MPLTLESGFTTDIIYSGSQCVILVRWPFPILFPALTKLHLQVEAHTVFSMLDRCIRIHKR